MAAQKWVDGQETPARSWSWSRKTRCQAVAPPVGLVELRTCPSWVTATHRAVVGQAMLLTGPKPGKWTVRHDARPAVGLVETSRSLLLSPTTHMPLDGQ